MGKEHRTSPAVPDTVPERAVSEEREIVCAACSAPITHEREAISVHGQHAHQFVNPSGESFRIRCFATAPGAIAVGAPSSFFSWFSGHTWQVALCRACQRHLGWKFEGASGTFHGLIVDRVA